VSALLLFIFTFSYFTLLFFHHPFIRAPVTLSSPSAGSLALTLDTKNITLPSLDSSSPGTNADTSSL
jgi:hypothetical protein